MRYRGFNNDLVTSGQVKIHFDRDLSRHRLSVLGGGLEFPAFDGIHCFFVQTFSQPADQRDMTGAAVSLHNQSDDAGALVVRLPRLLGILRLRMKDDLRRRNTPFGHLFVADWRQRRNVGWRLRWAGVRDFSLSVGG
jgi:hypothetical protein